MKLNKIIQFTVSLLFFLQSFSVLADQLVQGKDGVWRNLPESPQNQNEKKKDFDSSDNSTWGTKHNTVQMPDRETCIRELQGALLVTEKFSDVRKCLYKGDSGVCEKYNGGFIIYKCTVDNVLNVIH